LWRNGTPLALLIGRELNRVRASLGLPPVRRLFRWWLSPELMIGMFSQWYAAPQAIGRRSCGSRVFHGLTGRGAGQFARSTAAERRAVGRSAGGAAETRGPGAMPCAFGGNRRAAGRKNDLPTRTGPGPDLAVASKVYADWVTR